MKPTGGGFDAPTSEDALGRRAFAADIARIATKSPPEWSVRIGLYGRWGTGKTSALLMVQEIVEADDHRAVWFNPWGFDDIDAMWAGFVEAVFGALAEWGIRVPGEKTATIKASSERLMKLARSLLPTATPALTAAKFSDPTAAVASTAMETAASRAAPFLDKWLRVGRDELKGVTDALEGRRVVVLIDDVDRADAKLLPRMFHAVKELLDLPGFSFILALDPDVVGPVLRRQHEGFGVEFLEKVIDFPKWLPDPSREDLWRVASKDIEKYCSFLDADMLRRNFDLLPSNPRQLRMFIRQLWSLEAQVRRHNDEELDHAALVLVQLLKVLWPQLADAVFATDEFLKQLTTTRWFGARRARALEEPTDNITDFCAKFLPKDSADLPRSAKVLRLLRDSWDLPTADRVRYLAHLTERPHAVTWKEFHAFLKDWDGTEKHLTRWATQQSAETAHSVARVSSELFGAATRFYQRCCEHAADAAGETDVKTWMEKARTTLELLSALWQAQESLRAPTAFRDALGAFVAWRHFENHPAYRKQRQAERDFVMEMAKTAPPDHTQHFYGLVMQNAVRDASPYHRQQVGDLYTEVRELLAPRIAALCLALFRSPRAIKQVSRDRESRAEQSVLFDGHGPLWKEQRDEAFAVLAEARESTVVRQNVVDFLYEVVGESASMNGIGAASAAQVKALIEDGETANAIWAAACARAPNPRHLRSLIEVRDTLQNACGDELPTPPWWKRIAAEVGVDDDASQQDEPEGEE